jgi:hypothetical protein
MVGLGENGQSMSEGLKVYPNPTSGRFNIELEVDEASTFRMETYDMMGTRVHQGPDVHLPPGTNNLRADLTSLPRGTYLVSVLKDGQPFELTRVFLFD